MSDPPLSRYIDFSTQSAIPGLSEDEIEHRRAGAYPPTSPSAALRPGRDNLYLLIHDQPPIAGPLVNYPPASHIIQG